ncbi:MAG TPA: ribosome recycling factor [Oligoflexia bacterium]|nr:ribosome recycling factor [Oligoflexia bacterium]
MQAKDANAVVSEHEKQCQAAIGAFKRELQKLRTGRASAALVEGIHVDYYGAKTALSHLAQISTPEPRQIVVQVYDSGAVVAVDKAIRSADLGFNPMRDGNTLRILVPALTEETRRDIVKHLHKMGEEIRVSIRNHRRDANELLKKLEKAGDLTKDDAKKTLDKVQKLTDQYTQEVDKLLAAKEKECMEV